MQRITEYLTHYDVQLGADYQTSKLASLKLQESIGVLQEFINARFSNEVIIGSSSTMLLRILSLCLGQIWQPGDEVIITNADHEANRGCWLDLEKQGIKVKVWRINQKNLTLELDDLKRLLSAKTKLVAVNHVSNILGTINPIKQIAQIVHENGALICVDGVAFAPHRRVDVQDLDVDFYVFSTYKTFGPHQAVMYGKLDWLKKLPGLNHYFIDEIPYKFQPGNINYELSYSLVAIVEYVQKLGQSDLDAGFDLIADYEEYLTQHLIDYLMTVPDIKIIGEPTANKQLRVSTISFIHQQKQSSEIVKAVNKQKIGIRFGDFYAVELIDDLGLRDCKGVVRVSLLHYNTVEEVNSLIRVFEKIF